MKIARKIYTGDMHKQGLVMCSECGDTINDYVEYCTICRAKFVSDSYFYSQQKDNFIMESF